jgi:hypothetical protein
MIHNLAKSVLIIVSILLLQLLIYVLFLNPVIGTWGASKSETSMPMAGDDPALMVTSTRAILINAPQHIVWRGLMQLGADRSGFYSYEFLENALGYKTRYPDLTTPQFKDLKVGDIVRGSIDEKSSLIPYNFRVLYIKPEDTFVLQNWGTFLLNNVNSQQTRLIIRTQEAKNSNSVIRFAHYIFVPFHFIMERRTLIGIKVWAETGKNVSFSQSKDILWFANIIVSWLLICFLVFIGRGFIQSVIIPVALSISWLLVVLLLNPIILYSAALLLISCFAILGIVRMGKIKHNGSF